MKIRNLLIGRYCINLSRINYVQRFIDGKVAIYFSENERLTVEGVEADALWAFYASDLSDTKRITAPTVQLPEVSHRAYEPQMLPENRDSNPS